MRSTITGVLVCLVVIFPVTFIETLDRAWAGEKAYKRSIEQYVVPDVVLVDQNGTKVRLKDLLQTDKPVVLDFIFGTCTTICPILSAGYVNLQHKLGSDPQAIRLVSISIDPEHDTPKVLKEYLRRYRAKQGWDFLTGSREDIDKVMMAFGAYVQDKMSHYPLTLIRSPHDGTWIRLFGLMSTVEFMNEVQQVRNK
jgi:protein SCO1/2